MQNLKKIKSTILIVLFLSSCIWVTGSIVNNGWSETWQRISVPTMSPIFADMRTVKGSVESISLGLNPQLNNPGDPWGREMNYPIIWAKIASFLKFQNENNYLLFVGLYESLFVASLVYLLWLNPTLTQFFLSLSGATLICLERGNNDIVVFDLLLLSCLINRERVQMLLVFVASILKVFPAVVLVRFIKRNQIALPCVAVLLMVLFLNTEIIAIKKATPSSPDLSYGIVALSRFIDTNFKIRVTPWAILALHIVTVVIVYSILSKNKRFIEPTGVVKRLHVTGGLVYCATFLVGSNWDYRMIFLLICAPYLNHAIRGWKAVLLLVVFIFATNFVIAGKYFGLYGLAFNMLSKSAIFVIITVSLIHIFKEGYEKLYICGYGESKRVKWIFESSAKEYRYKPGDNIALLRGKKLLALNPTNIVLFANNNKFNFDESYKFYLDGWYSALIIPNGVNDYCPGHVVLENHLQYAVQNETVLCFVVPSAGTKELLKSKLSAVYPNLNYSIYVWSTNDRTNDGISQELILLREKINANESIVIFGVGSGVQETVAKHWDMPNELVCIGAALDFFCGAQRVAPPYIRKIRIEWLYRLTLNPKRMWRRVILHPLIMLQIWIGCKIK